MQSAGTLLMVRPASFGFNEETAATNVFQARIEGTGDGRLQEQALREFDALVAAIRAAGGEVIVVEDRADRRAPDAVFPNNWISLHHDGTVVIYPMCAPLRRRERRLDIVAALETRHGFRVSRVLDFTAHEREGRFLEGTGSLVFDHVHRCAYAGVSLRTDPELAREAADALGYDLVVFHATDEAGQAVYHTNVVMSIGERFAVIADAAIGERAEREAVVGRLAATGRALVRIDRGRMARFAANVLEVAGAGGRRAVAMSTSARAAFRPDEIAVIAEHAAIVASPLDTIETVGGGSARCMIAEVHLPRAPGRA